MNRERVIVRLRQLRGAGKSLRDDVYAPGGAVEKWENTVLTELGERPDLQERFLTDPPKSLMTLLAATTPYRPRDYRRLQSRLAQIDWIIEKLKRERPPAAGPSTAERRPQETPSSQAVQVQPPSSRKGRSVWQWIK